MQPQKSPWSHRLNDIVVQEAGTLEEEEEEDGEGEGEMCQFYSHAWAYSGGRLTGV